MDETLSADQRAVPGVHHTEVFQIAVVPLDMSWFRVRITTDRYSAIIDNDITTGPVALRDLEALAADASLCLPQSIIERTVRFEDEGCDAGLLCVSCTPDGWLQLTITDSDWLDWPPRLDVWIKTERFLAETARACAAFRAVDRLDSDSDYWRGRVP